MKTRGTFYGMRTPLLAAGDQVAIMRNGAAQIDSVLEICRVSHVGNGVIYLDDGRVYDCLSGSGLTCRSKGVMFIATTEHFNALAARQAVPHETAS